MFNKFIFRKGLSKRIIVFRDLEKFSRASLYLYRFSLFYFLYFLVFIADLNFLYFFARRLGDEEIQLLVSSNYIFVLIINVSILFQTITLTKKYSNLRLIRFLISLIIVFLFTGTRAYILIPILFLIIDFFSKKGIVYVLPLILVSIISFSWLGSVRSFDNIDDFSIENVIEKSERFSINKYQMQDRDLLSIKYYENRPLFYGSSYMAIFTSFIPRSILGDYKPEMLDGKIGREVFKNYNAGYPLHPVTESILNFGYFGYLVLFIIGFILSNFLSSSSSFLSYSISSYLILVAQTTYSTYCLYAFQYIIVIFFISLLTRRKASLK
ncbi:hypothetical protein OA257_01440 [Bacteroidota bacterium]|nr:hypothetical protein [Bacteroidota bacterium]